MAIHSIPEDEKELHEESEDCQCGPLLKIDEETGEMIWIHEFLKLEDLIDDMIKI